MLFEALRYDVLKRLITRVHSLFLCLAYRLPSHLPSAHKQLMQITNSDYEMFMKNKLSNRRPHWSRIVRRKTRELKNELFEVALGYFICSELTNDIVERIHDTFIVMFVHSLQNNINAIGLLRVILPVLIVTSSFYLRKLIVDLFFWGWRSYQKMPFHWSNKLRHPREPEGVAESK